MPAAAETPERRTPDPYRGVVLLLLLAALLGAGLAAAGGWRLALPGLFDAAITFVLAAGILAGVAAAQSRRGRPPLSREEPPSSGSPPDPVPSWLVFVRGLGPLVRFGTGLTVLAAIIWVALRRPGPAVPAPTVALALTVAACLVVAGLSAVAARYLADAERLPEAAGLCRGARVLAWLMVLTALCIALERVGQRTAAGAVRAVVLGVDIAVSYGLLASGRSDDLFGLDFAVLTLLGSRFNVVASILDAARRQLGIDLRSTWALTVGRRSVEPLLIGLLAVGWLSTSLTVVALDEQGLVERLGVPAGGEPLAPGLHLHLPWPLDRVFRIPVQQVQTVEVGHEGEVTGPPPEGAEAVTQEDMIWTVPHAAIEFNLLLGNGRDLVTVDIAVQYRVKDAKAWLYHCADPEDALKAVAYQAVMRATVNRTLSDVLSENLVSLRERLHQAVQRDADAMELGAEVVDLTLGGMHPATAVAPDYEAVTSAEVAKVTAVVTAQAYRNQLVPRAEAAVLTGTNAAQAEGADKLARSAGEAWSFRTLQAQYHAAPGEYLFRRRLESLERGLAGRRFTVVDSRIERDGGELWLTP